MNKNKDNWKSSVPVGEVGEAKVKKFTITEEEANSFNLRHIIRGTYDHCIEPGDYTKLTIKGNTMMSDTPKEYLDHRELFHMAHGHVLILGLGLGCALNVVASMEEVTKVTVIELSPDVIKLVAPSFEKFGDKVEIIEGDAFGWRPPKGQRYGMTWADIWLDIGPDNLPEMRVLKQRFTRRSTHIACWSEDEARHLKKCGW